MCANISTSYTFPSMVKIKVKTADGVRKGQGKERGMKREGEMGERDVKDEMQWREVEVSDER